MSDDHTKYRAEFIKVLSDFQAVWDSHLKRFSAAQHIIEQLAADMRPAQSAPYRARPKAREVEKNEIAKIIDLRIMELTQTEC